MTAPSFRALFAETRPQFLLLYMYLKPTKKHLAAIHLKEQTTQPFDKQQFVIGRLAGNLHFFFRFNTCQIGYDGRQSHRRLPKRLRLGRADPAHADIGLMLKMFPKC